MITSIARQSLIIKCNMQCSILLGNYEFYYAAGLFSKLFGVEVPEDGKPEEIMEILLDKIPQINAENEQEKYLLALVKAYKPGEEYDEQMKELLLCGKQEQNLWQVVI